ncbi:MAG: hypothetical protein N2C12_10350, partial [Planctomycetales bacterium]
MATTPALRLPNLRFIALPALLAVLILPLHNRLAAGDRDPIRVVVWDERQPEQKQAYNDQFLGDSIAVHLADQKGFEVRSHGLDDANQGLDDTVLDFAEVIIWWGHVRHSQITPETGRKIVERIVDGRLSLIALHSAHWSTPFVEAMNEKTRRAAIMQFDSSARQLKLNEIPLRKRYYLPKLDEP